MEVTRPAAATVVQSIDDESAVGEARRRTRLMAMRAGFDQKKQEEVAIVTAELSRNIFRYAGKGTILATCCIGDLGQFIDIQAVDKGPGMKNVQECLQDGYSTGNTPGTGLGAVRRLANEFDLFSLPGKGTAVAVRFYKQQAPASEWSVSGLNAPFRENEACGDTWNCCIDRNRLIIVAADGLGHGPSAAEASQLAAKLLIQNDLVDLYAQFKNAHELLKKTRGTAAAVTVVSPLEKKVFFTGIGNISARIISAQKETSLSSRHGTLGLALPSIKTYEYDWDRRSLLVIHSDGVSAKWSMQDYPSALHCHTSVIAAILYRDHARSRDDNTVVVVRQKHF